MRIEGRKRERVHCFEMHWHENLAWTHYGGDQGNGGCPTASRAYVDLFAIDDAEAFGIERIQLNVEFARRELAEDGAFVGACAGMPLG